MEVEKEGIRIQQQWMREQQQQPRGKIFQGLVGPAAAAHSPWRTGDGGTSSFLKERKGKVLPFLYYGIYYNKKMVFFFFFFSLTAI